MQRILFLLFALTTLNYAHGQRLSVYALSVENKVNAFGIDDKQPRLSWKLKGTGRGVRQTAYEVSVSVSDRSGKDSLVWSSGKVKSEQSRFVPYEGPLQSSTAYIWQVKVWDNKNNASAWAESRWETGFLSRDDWKAKWIEPEQDTTVSIPALMLRKDFAVSKKVRTARAYVTAHGLYELSINGKKIGDDVLTPGWTSYNKRLQYQVYDITNAIQTGDNALGAFLGDGWYRGRLAWEGNYGIWGKTLGLLCQVEIVFQDGSRQTIITDKSWKSSTDGPIIMNSIYDGETYDARKEMSGWNKPGYDDKNWTSSKEAQYKLDNLIATEATPVRKIQRITPVNIFKTPKGTLVADMGQNMVGWISLKVQGPAGTKVVIRHAEVLDKKGEFYTDNLRAAKATMTYTLKGSDDVEVYEPRFTFFGFRYIAIEGFPGELRPENITGVVVHSAMTPTGTFSCSNPMINQLQSNIVWGQKGNFLDVPTDCPQRDERLGWTGDAQAFCRTAAFNMDVSSFFTKWMKDVSADQMPDGKIPFVVPDALVNIKETSAGWGDVATITPWTMYLVYGDKRILETQYESMKSFVGYIERTAGPSFIWKGGSVFGDWLYFKPRMEDHTVPDGHTDRDMIATMFYAYSAKLVANTAKVLGKEDDVRRYSTLFNQVRDAFNREYVAASGRIVSDSQTSYVLALMFDLLSPPVKEKAITHLVNDIKSRGNHLSTGFLGTPYLCHVLSENGQQDVAYDLLLQESFPSWLFPVKMGATTIWERWDGQKPDSTFQDTGMNSFNHYAYGAIGDWLYQVVAGIEAGKPGYKEIIIQPHPDRRLTFAKATLESSYGEIASGWKYEGDVLVVNATIPANTTAHIVLPQASIADVTFEGKSIQNNPLFRNLNEEHSKVVFEVGSGNYEWRFKIKQKPGF